MYYYNKLKICFSFFKMMKLNEVSNNCRICLQESKKLRSIYRSADDEEEPPYKMLYLVTGIRLEMENEKLSAAPQNICRACELSLHLAYEFRQRALQSQRLIEMHRKQFLKADDQDFENFQIKVEEDEEFENSQVFLQENFLDIQYEGEESGAEVLEDKGMDVQDEQSIDVQICDPIEQEDVDGKAEYLDESFLLLEEVSDNENFIKTELPDGDEDPSSYVEEEVKLVDESSGKCEIEMPSAERGPKKKNKGTTKQTRKLDSSSSLKNIFTMDPTIPKAFASGHICDICGNMFEKRGRLTEHRRRHNKELNYACEICDKRFHLREKLSKHMYMHSGGKPHKCSYCSRTFFYESVKKAHEAVHKGYKPGELLQC